MTLWIMIAILIIVALAFVVPPLLKKTNTIEDDRREQNIQIAKQQLAELEAEYKEGRIEEIAYTASKEELEQSLYDDLQPEDVEVETRSSLFENKVALIALLVLVPVGAIATYSQLENTEVLKVSADAHNQITPEQRERIETVEKMVGTLEERLKAEPNNVEGWVMLGRTYTAMSRFTDALRSYEKSYELKKDDPKILLPLADLLGTVNDGILKGRPEALIQQALEKEPENWMGLWLAGSAAQQRAANDEALKHWKKLENILPAGSADQQQIQSLILQVGGQPTPGAGRKPEPVPEQNAAAPAPKADATAAGDAKPTAAIKLSVSLSAELASKVKPEDTVFIYAKAMSGPPMPLAAAKKQVKDLPLEITLDDSMAMMPQMKISQFNQVVVGARISLSGGGPQAQTGDLFAEKDSIKLGDTVALEINQVVK